MPFFVKPSFLALHDHWKADGFVGIIMTITFTPIFKFPKVDRWSSCHDGMTRFNDAILTPKTLYT